MQPDTAKGSWITTDIPGRLDALGWSRWHGRLVLALGITWVLDGLEASLIANLAPSLQDARALVFGHLTDRWGRKRLFLVTLGLYLVATASSGLASSFALLGVFRLLAGA